jgi:hypothetical protein
MSKQESNVAVTQAQIGLAKKLDGVVSVLGSETMQGFERAFQIANAIQELKTLLTPEYMKPIMALQGNKLGFKTDKDTSGGYSEEIVKNCLIEAVLTGFAPYENQFNIIAGSMYGTKEGFGAALNKIKGLSWDIIPSLPRINAAKDGAAVLMKITWIYGSEPEQSKEIDFAVKMNQYAGTDAAIGKATRKARAWLFNKINGTEVGEGDVQDVDFKVVPNKPEPVTKEAKEEERILLLISDCKSLTALRDLEKYVTENTKAAFEAKKTELIEAK